MVVENWYFKLKRGNQDCVILLSLTLQGAMLADMEKTFFFGKIFFFHHKDRNHAYDSANGK